MKEKTNVEIIKETILKQIDDLKKKNHYIDFYWEQKIYNEISILLLNEIKITQSKGLTQEKKLNYYEIIDKYKDKINNWKPTNDVQKLNVFWLKGFLYSDLKIDECLNGFYNKFGSDLVNAILQTRNTAHIETILFKLALNKNLNEKDFKTLEKNYFNGYLKKVHNMPLFKKLTQIGDNYNSSLIWEYYIEIHKGNYVFLDKVKEQFKKENREYEFESESENLNLFSINNYSRKLKIDTQTLYRYNNQVKKSNVDDFVMALNNWFHSYAKKIEEEASMDVKYIKSGEREIVINFNSKESLNRFDEELKRVEPHFKNIIGNIDLEKNKTGSEYLNELDKNANYYYFNEKLSEKNQEKKLKI